MNYTVKRLSFYPSQAGMKSYLVTSRLGNRKNDNLFYSVQCSRSLVQAGIALYEIYFIVIYVPILHCTYWVLCANNNNAALRTKVHSQKKILRKIYKKLCGRNKVREPNPLSLPPPPLKVCS
jgi:hypothetical protein